MEIEARLQNSFGHSIKQVSATEISLSLPRYIRCYLYFNVLFGNFLAQAFFINVL